MPHHDVNTEPFGMADDVALRNLRHLPARLQESRADAILTTGLNRGFSKCLNITVVDFYDTSTHWFS
jgi:hypothetical protein